MIHRTIRAGLPWMDQDTPEPWVDQEIALRDKLDAIEAIGGFSITPRDVDANINPTSRYFGVATGYLRHGSSYLQTAAVPDILGVASSDNYVWIDAFGNILTDVAEPAPPYELLGIVHCDATKITGITDARSKASIWPPGIVGTVRTLAATAVLSVADTFVLGNAAAAPITLTLPAAYDSGMAGRSILIAKIDGTANALTVGSAGGTLTGGTVAGGATYAMTTRTAALFTSDGSNWYFFKFG